MTAHLAPPAELVLKEMRNSLIACFTQMFNAYQPYLVSWC